MTRWSEVVSWSECCATCTTCLFWAWRKETHKKGYERERVLPVILARERAQDMDARRRSANFMVWSCRASRHRRLLRRPYTRRCGSNAELAISSVPRREKRAPRAAVLRWCEGACGRSPCAESGLGRHGRGGSVTREGERETAGWGCGVQIKAS